MPLEGLASGPLPHSLEGLGFGSPQFWVPWVFFIVSPRPWLLLWGLGFWTESPQLDPGFGVLWSGVFDPPLPTQVLLLLVLVLVRPGSLQQPEQDRSLSLSQPTEPVAFWGSPQWLLAPDRAPSPPLPHPSLPFPILEPQPCCCLGVLFHVLDLRSASKIKKNTLKAGRVNKLIFFCKHRFNQHNGILRTTHLSGLLLLQVLLVLLLPL